MSRHVVLDLPNQQIVVGFDRMLQSFFGQRFDPSDARRDGIAIGGWPTRSGLGVRRPVATDSHARDDLGQLGLWVMQQRWARSDDILWGTYVARVLAVLEREWFNGVDCETPAFPASLTEGR